MMPACTTSAEQRGSADTASEWSVETKHCSQRPGSTDGVPWATPHRSHGRGDIGMLQRLQRHIRQITSVSLAFNGLTLTDFPQMEQAVIRRLERAGASCSNIFKPPCFGAPSRLPGSRPS